MVSFVYTSLYLADMQIHRNATAREGVLLLYCGTNPAKSSTLVSCALLI